MIYEDGPPACAEPRMNHGFVVLFLIWLQFDHRKRFPGSIVISLVAVREPSTYTGQSCPRQGLLQSVVGRSRSKTKHGDNGENIKSALHFGCRHPTPGNQILRCMKASQVPAKGIIFRKIEAKGKMNSLSQFACFPSCCFCNSREKTLVFLFASVMRGREDVLSMDRGEQRHRTRWGGDGCYTAWCLSTAS